MLHAFSPILKMKASGYYKNSQSLYVMFQEAVSIHKSLNISCFSSIYQKNLLSVVKMLRWLTAEGHMASQAQAQCLQINEQKEI